MLKYPIQERVSVPPLTTWTQRRWRVWRCGGRKLRLELVESFSQYYKVVSVVDQS